MVRAYTALVFITLVVTFEAVAQFAEIKQLNPVPVSTNTGEKPQSKVWSYGGKHWAVLPNTNGTYLWQLNGTTWASVLKLSGKSTTKADCKLVGNTAHILLFQGPSSELASVEYDSELDTYKFWSKRNSTIGINLDNAVETATIDIDGKGRMWLVGDGTTNIYVQWSDSPYQFWSDRFAVASGVSSDDIGTLVAMPGKIGVLWSNQKTKRFGFRTHTDGASPTDWSADEVPASQSAQNVGAGMADDHLNMVVARDGTVFAAVKTSYENSDFPEIALLVRRPSGQWDDLYEVSRVGTRPIVLLDEPNSKIIIVYTSKDSGGDILYKESLTSAIAFGNAFTLIKGSYNNATSTKDPFSGEVIVLASNSTNAVGVMAINPVIPLPVELVNFTAKLIKDDVLVQWVTASELDNGYFSVEVSMDGKQFEQLNVVPGNGTTQRQNRYAYTDANIYRYQSDQVYYRLRQVDFSGEQSIGPVRSVQLPALTKELSLRAFPNPFQNNLQVQIKSPEAAEASLTLYNAQGKVVLSHHPTLQVGQNIIHFSNILLAEGIYFLSVRTSGQQHTIKMLRR